MWIKTTIGTLVNTDKLYAIQFNTLMGKTIGYTTGSDHIMISDNDATETIVNAITRGATFVEVR